MESTKRGVYFRREFHGGRGSLARALDVIVLRVSVFAAAYVALAFYVRPAMLAFLLAALIVAMFSIVAHMLNRSRYERFVQRSMDALLKDYLVERLLMMPKEQLRAVVEAYTLKLPNVCDLWEQDGNLLARRADGSFLLVGMLQCAKESVSSDELLVFYRAALECSASGMLLYSTTAFAPDAEALAKRLSMPVSLFPPKRLIELAKDAELLPSDAEVEEALDVIIAQKREQRTSLKKAAFRGKGRRYVMCAVVLAFASVLTGYYIYYPVFAAICASMGLMTWWLNREKASNGEVEQQGAQAAR